MKTEFNIYNSVEEELWRIFTFYALHSDPTMPEIMKPANFIKFCKDCQITSSRFTPAAVELELTRQSRIKTEGNDYNPSTTINFMDFMQMLEILSVKVYPRDSPAEAAKKLVLENVLLLAHRRVPTNDMYDLDNTLAVKVVMDTFTKPLQKIFNYYLDKAGQRRSNAVSLEKMKQREILRQNGFAETDKEAVAAIISPFKQQSLIYLKNLAKTQKDMISYKEYLMFAQDFGLKSTVLLTATQLGEIFLNIVPLQSAGVTNSDNDTNHNNRSVGNASANAAPPPPPSGSAAGSAAGIPKPPPSGSIATGDVGGGVGEGGGGKNSSSGGSSHAAVSHHKRHNNESAGEGMMVAGMNFHQFRRGLIFMALVAYRNLDPAVPTHYKVQALLLYMWKATNDGYRTLQVLNRDRTHTLSSSTGHLNLYGSTDFSREFQMHWRRDGCVDYTVPPEQEVLTGTTMMRKLVGESNQSNSSEGAPDSSSSAAAAGSGWGFNKTNSASVSNSNNNNNNNDSDGHTVNSSVGAEGAGTMGNENSDGSGQKVKDIATSSKSSHNNTVVAGVEGLSFKGFTLSSVEQTPERAARQPFPVNVETKDLQKLLERKPELVEYLFLEIQNMKLETDRLTAQV
mmetsp:Transcript_6304/g.10551  ORF Transcript_6304/g.10551 Transcript_6304/m.10551 type:complete len:624 (+) Transcript_6304:126-1997(+)